MSLYVKPEMAIVVTEAFILQRANHSDTIILSTKLPVDCENSEDKAVLMMKVPRGTGQRYCEENFPMIELSITGTVR